MPGDGVQGGHKIDPFRVIEGAAVFSVKRAHKACAPGGQALHGVTHAGVLMPARVNAIVFCPASHVKQSSTWNQNSTL